ncbi:hypothetical protein GY45DRAFT_727508 [Cubamyces sp. BRFM 1775]|nr:hypothetical protein GY45DRAFT_727508 [Cubamyces sp. BRFM 1775]
MRGDEPVGHTTPAGEGGSERGRYAVCGNDLDIGVRALEDIGWGLGLRGTGVLDAFHHRRSKAPCCLLETCAGGGRFSSRFTIQQRDPRLDCGGQLHGRPSSWPLGPTTASLLFSFCIPTCNCCALYLSLLEHFSGDRSLPMPMPCILSLCALTDPITSQKTKSFSGLSFRSQECRPRVACARCGVTCCPTHAGHAPPCTHPGTMFMTALHGSPPFSHSSQIKRSNL